MTSISWNDIEGEDSSLSDLSSDIDQINRQVQETTKLKKIISQPLPKTSQTQLQKKQNLEKLLKHKGDKVWVYSPNFYKQREEQVNKIINSIPYFEVDKFKNSGWNINVKIQKAKMLIQEGYQSSGMKLKFIYSTLNKKFKQQNYDNKKGNRDNRGIISPKNKIQKQNNMRSIKSRQKPVYKQKGNIQQTKQKKKVKYVAKEQELQCQQKINKIQQQETIPQIKSPQENENHIGQPQNLQQTSQQQKQLIQEKQEPQIIQDKIQQKKQEVKDEDLQKQEKVQVKEQIQVVQSDKDSEQSLKNMKKQLQKKKKKPKGKKKNKKKQIDNNNPFSYFDQ